MSSLLTNEQKECGKIKRQSQQNIIKLYEIVWGEYLHSLQSEAISGTKYEDMAEIYNMVWVINKLKFFAGVDSHI